MSEQAVIVRFTYGQTNLGPLYELEDKLSAAIETTEAGEFDGNEVAVDGSEGTLYMYGPDADRLFEAVRQCLSPLLVFATPSLQFVTVLQKMESEKER